MALGCGDGSKDRGKKGECLRDLEGDETDSVINWKQELQKVPVCGAGSVVILVPDRVNLEEKVWRGLVGPFTHAACSLVPL